MIITPILHVVQATPQGYAVFGKGLHIKPKMSERVLFHERFGLPGAPLVLPNP